MAKSRQGLARTRVSFVAPGRTATSTATATRQHVSAKAKHAGQAPPARDAERSGSHGRCL